jgi:pimeloyl-ACP methyl ester carboxylesterase
VKTFVQTATTNSLRGFGKIDRQSKPRRRRGPLAAAAVLAIALLGLAAPTGAAAAGIGVGPAVALTPEKPEPPPKPQLLLFHGGSFLFQNPFFEPAVVARSLAAGFEPHFIDYPLGNVPEAVTDARAEARELRQEYGLSHVYAYGASAGGTLASLLAGDGLVAGAVAKAPVSDLVDWPWATETYGSNYYEKVGLGEEAARYRYSPSLRPEVKSPLLVYQGVNDQVVPATMSATFAEKFENVYLWYVPGGHATDETRPWLVQRALDWLARIAQRQEKAAESSQRLAARKGGPR